MFNKGDHPTFADPLVGLLVAEGSVLEAMELQAFYEADDVQQRLKHEVQFVGLEEVFNDGEQTEVDSIDAECEPIASAKMSRFFKRSK